MASCSCVVEESAVTVTVPTPSCSRKLSISMAVACRSGKLNDCIPSTKLGTTFSLRVHESELELWLVFARYMVGEGTGARLNNSNCSDRRCIADPLLGRSRAELHRILQAAKRFRDDHMIGILEKHLVMLDAPDQHAHPALMAHAAALKRARGEDVVIGSQRLPLRPLLMQRQQNDTNVTIPAAVDPMDPSAHPILDFPAFWDQSRSSQAVHLVTVAPNSEEWNDVLVQTKDCMHDRLISIQRIQNSALWAAYKMQRDLLLNCKYLSSQVRVHAACPGTQPVLERRMWHGTRCNRPESIYSSALGWCPSYSGQGRFGQGSYFAFDPRYCMHGYASRSSDGQRCQLLLADVLTGAMWTSLDAAAAASDRRMNEPPNLSPEHQWYHLLRNTEVSHKADSVGNHSICAVFGWKKALAYPRYLVTYQHQQQQPR